jgi:acetyl-CoA carboxylase beta subunit
MEILFILSPFILILILTSAYSIWYNRNYITHESTKNYPSGWHKCWNCKKVESTIYFRDTLHGRVYYCFQCSKSK